jgi:hypothetical protein
MRLRGASRPDEFRRSRRVSGLFVHREIRRCSEVLEVVVPEIRRCNEVFEVVVHRGCCSQGDQEISL